MTFHVSHQKRFSHIWLQMPAEVETSCVPKRGRVRISALHVRTQTEINAPKLFQGFPLIKKA